MSLRQVKQAVGQIKCEVVGHEISDEAEGKVFTVHSRSYETNCPRCGARLLLEMNETNEDEYFETEL